MGGQSVGSGKQIDRQIKVGTAIANGRAFHDVIAKDFYVGRIKWAGTTDGYWYGRKMLAVHRAAYYSRRYDGWSADFGGDVDIIGVRAQSGGRQVCPGAKDQEQNQWLRQK